MKWRRFIPHILLFFGALGYALWSFVRRPFPMLDEIVPCSISWTTTPPTSTAG